MSDKPDALLVTTVRGGLVLSLITSFIPGPAVSIGPLDLIMFDLVMVFLTLLLAVYLFYNPQFVLPKHRLIGITSTAYFGLALGLPVAGLIVYNNPIEYFIGDIRWIQVFIIGTVMVTLYNQSLASLIQDVEFSMKIIILFNFFIFIMQFLDANNIVTTNKIIQIWYYGKTPYGGTGYHINRYAGAVSGPSSLGRTTAVAIALFGRSSFVNRSGYSYFSLAIILLLASGSRTAIVAVIGIGGVIAVYNIINNTPSRSLINKIEIGGFSLVALFSVAYWLNIGRIATSDRYSEIITVLISPDSFLKLSGRGTHWRKALAQMENYPIGTLSNPSWVFNDLTVIDSYFVMTYLQGKVPFLTIYITLLIVLLIISFQYLYFGNYAILSLSFIFIIISFSLTSNFMTSIDGKIVLILSIVVLVLTIVKLSETTP